MFTFIKFYLNSFQISAKNTVVLGRWKLKHDCLKKEIISSFYANSDHCGDKICGDTLKNRELLYNKLNQIKK